MVLVGTALIGIGGGGPPRRLTRFSRHTPACLRRIVRNRSRAPRRIIQCRYRRARLCGIPPCLCRRHDPRTSSPGSTFLCALASPSLSRGDPVRARRRQSPGGAERRAAGRRDRLAPGATFTGNFVLPVVAGASTHHHADRSARRRAAAGRTSASRRRPRRSFAEIVSPNTGAALRTAPGAHHWRVHVRGVPRRRRTATATSSSSATARPRRRSSRRCRTRSIVDRVYIHGDPLYGQKRGIALQRAATSRSAIPTSSEIKAVGADAQAIGGWNGPGPFSIENNYLEGVGRGLHARRQPIRRSRTWSARTCSFRYNYMSRPMSWRDPIIATPAGVTAAAAPAAGRCRRASTRTAWSRGGQSDRARSATSPPSAEVTAALPTSGARAPSPGRRCRMRPNTGSTGARRRATQYWTVTGTSLHRHRRAGQGRRRRRRRRRGGR